MLSTDDVPTVIVSTDAVGRRVTFIVGGVVV
jgi:hypothetical protein